MFKTGELSRAFEIDRTSLNYYVRIGLLNPEILDNQYHTYSFQDFIALSYIRHYRGFGFSTEDIRRLTQKEDHAGKLRYGRQAMQTMQDQIRLLQMKQRFLENFMNAVEFAESCRSQPVLASTEAYYFIRREEIEDPVMKELYKLLPSNEFAAHCDQDFRVELKIQATQGLALKEAWVQEFQLPLPSGAIYYPAELKCLCVFKVTAPQLDEQLRQHMKALDLTMQRQNIRLCRDFIAYMLINHYNSPQESFDIFVYIPLETLD